MPCSSHTLLNMYSDGSPAGTVTTTIFMSPARSLMSASSSPSRRLFRSSLTARAKLCHQHSSGVKWVLFTTNLTLSPAGTVSESRSK